jgi:type II secretory pathway pseudopilin PulG
MVSPPHTKDRRLPDRRTTGFTLAEVMIVTFISSFVFAGVLSAYVFLGRGLVRQGNEEQLESRSRLTLYDFTQDISGASSVVSASATVLEVNTWIPLNNGNPPVLGTATYIYDPINAQLTLARTSTVPSTQLAFPSWATPNTVSALVLLNNLTSFSFGTYDIAGNSTGVPALIKQVNMSFTTTAGSRVSGAQSHFTVVSPQVIMKNKFSPQ